MTLQPDRGCWWGCTEAAECEGLCRDMPIDVVCPCCGGEGEVSIGAPWIDYRNGDVITPTAECGECHGAGGIWIEPETRSLRDIEHEDMEAA